MALCFGRELAKPGRVFFIQKHVEGLYILSYSQMIVILISVCYIFPY